MTLSAFLILEDETGSTDHIAVDKSPFTIGRDPGCDLTIDVSGVSRLHAQIERKYGQYTLTDMRSTNGTYINDNRIVGEALLRDGDEVRLGALVHLYFDDPAATDQMEVSTLSLGGIQIDETRKEVYIDSRLLDPPLSPSQYTLLELLVQREEEVVERDEIAETVWPDEVHITDQMIDTLVSRLRKRLALYDADKYIVTRRGFGFMFSCD